MDNLRNSLKVFVLFGLVWNEIQCQDEIRNIYFPAKNIPKNQIKLNQPISRIVKRSEVS